MINLLLGGPGAGKSYEATVYHVLPALMRGRKVVTNLPLDVDAFRALDPSFPDLIEIREKTLGTKPERPVSPISRAPEWSPRPFANPEDFADEWRHPEGYGPLYLVDECHFCMPVGRTAQGVEEWMSMHRHFNADVLLITQSSGKISRAIRDLVQVCYKVRKAVALGKPDGYIRKVLDGVNGGEVSVTQRKYQKQYFGLYRSHTQGLALAEQKADDVAPFIVKFKRFTWAFWACAVPFAVWAFWPKAEKPRPSIATAVQQAQNPQVVQSRPEPAASGPEASGTPAPAGQVEILAPGEVPEPFSAKLLHLTGRMSMGARTIYTFAISAGSRRIGEVTSADLHTMGYRWEPLTDCAGTLRWKTTARAITCDPPELAQGNENRPIVLAVPAGTSAPVASSRDRAVALQAY